MQDSQKINYLTLFHSVRVPTRVDFHSCIKDPKTALIPKILLREHITAWWTMAKAKNWITILLNFNDQGNTTKAANFFHQESGLLLNRHSDSSERYKISFMPDFVRTLAKLSLISRQYEKLTKKIIGYATGLLYHLDTQYSQQVALLELLEAKAYIKDFAQIEIIRVANCDERDPITDDDLDVLAPRSYLLSSKLSFANALNYSKSSQIDGNLVVLAIFNSTYVRALAAFYKFNKNQKVALNLQISDILNLAEKAQVGLIHSVEHAKFQYSGKGQKNPNYYYPCSPVTLVKCLFSIAEAYILIGEQKKANYIINKVPEAVEGLGLLQNPLSSYYLLTEFANLISFRNLSASG